MNRQNQCDWESPGKGKTRTMADNVNEESDYNPGKDELDWGYEEGRLPFITFPLTAEDMCCSLF